MIRIRPIASDELPAFLDVEGDPERAADQASYVDRMVRAGAMRLEWCHLAEADGRTAGRFAFWTLPSLGDPMAIVLLDVDRAVTEPPDRATVAAAMLGRAIDDARRGSPPEFGYVLDDPPQTPQWQLQPDERTGWLEAAGFFVARSTSRWTFDGPAPITPVTRDRLSFRSFEDVGEVAFLDALARVSAATADARIRADRERLGPEGEAREMLDDLRSIEVRPGWWQLAYDRQGDLVGLVAPAAAPGMATIGHIGVVPEQRGHRYVDDLLARGTAVLRREMPDRPIKADTDLANHAMAAAFERAGYTRFATRREFEVEL